MIKFNLDLVKKGHPVITRDGRKVRIIATDRAGKTPIIALVRIASGDEFVCAYAAHGRWLEEVDSEHKADLMMAPAYVVKYFAVYRKKADGTITIGSPQDTRAQAEKLMSNYNSTYFEALYVKEVRFDEQESA